MRFRCIVRLSLLRVCIELKVPSMLCTLSMARATVFFFVGLVSISCDEAGGLLGYE